MKNILLIIAILILILQMVILATPWDISTATYTAESSITADTSHPRGIFFKPDGTKFYLCSSDDITVYQFDVSTPWDITTETNDSKSLDCSGEISIYNLYGIFFKPDGYYCYVTARYDTIYQYVLSTAWDISTAAYDNKSYSPTEDNPFSIYFKDDGSKMYMLHGLSDETVYQYTLSTPWDISTAGYDTKSFDVQTEAPAACYITMKSDGTILYVVGTTNDTIYQYDIDTPWDISTCDYDNVFLDISAKETTPRAMFLKLDGTEVYISGDQVNDVTQYSMPAAAAFPISKYSGVEITIWNSEEITVWNTIE